MSQRPLGYLAIFAFLWGTAANAKLPDGVTIDDAFTWFSVKSYETPVDGKATDQGWALQYTVRFLGDIPAFSGVRTVVSKDGDELANVRRTQVQGDSTSFFEPGMMIMKKIYEEGDLIVGDGVFDVALYYIDANTDEEHLAREYKLDVRKVHKQHQLRFVNPPNYYVNHHGNIKDAVIAMRKGGEGNYIPGAGGLQSDTGVSQVADESGLHRKNWVSTLVYVGTDDPSAVVRMAHAGGGSRLAGTAGYLTAKVDGEPVALTDPDLRFLDAPFINLRNLEIVVHTDRYAKEYHRGTEYREPIGFTRYLLNLPLTWGPPDQRVENYVALNDHPGEWELNWILNGQPLRTWRFEVNDDGLIEPHPDEDDVDLTFAPRTHLVDMGIPEGGSVIDQRLAPEFVRELAFYGLGLPKSLTKGVPTKGKPFPEFSGEYVEPEDPGAADKARRQEVKDRVAAEQAAKKAERDAKETARQAELQAGREAAAEEDARREAEHEARQAEIAALVESEKAKAMAEVEKLTGASREAAEELEREARYSGGLPFWIRLLLGLSLIGGGVVLAGPFIKEKAEPAKGVVDALLPLGTLFGWALLALALVSLLVDLVYLRPLIANGLPQVLALAGGLVLARGAIKEKLASVSGGAADKAAKAKEALEKQEARFALLDNNAVAIGLAAIVAGLLHLLIGGTAIL